MSGSINFATGNSRKLAEARRVLDEFGIGVIGIEIDIDEIQHHDPAKVTQAKAIAAYEATREPVVVNDSHWAVPALGGFPGAYMKDVAQWFTPENFLALLANEKDRRVLLTDVVGYFDGEAYESFSAVQQGVFIDAPRGSGGNSLNKVVSMNSDNGMSIAEILDLHESGKRLMSAARAPQWQLFAEWYSKQ